MRELVAHALAVLERDAAFGIRVDRHSEEPPWQALELHELVPEPFDRAGDKLRGRRGMIHRNGFLNGLNKLVRPIGRRLAPLG